MAINWFEGGRRITKLFMSVIAAGGAIYVIVATPPPVVYATDAPDEPWIPYDGGCSYPSHSEYLGNRAFSGGVSRKVALCFRASVDGRIPYALAPRPIDEAPPLIRTHVSPSGKPVTPGPQYERRWYFIGNAFDAKVESYMLKRKSDFALTPELQRAARKEFNLTLLSGKSQAFAEALPWVLGLIAGIWALTATIGWIVRGFAGVPSGKDFRST